MGHESRLYVVKKSNVSSYAEKLAVLYLSCIGGKPDVFKNPVEYDVYIRSEDYRTIKDDYGEKLTDCSLDEAIECIEQLRNDVELHYRRFTMALGLLNAIKSESQWNDENIRVIHYGY